MYPLSASKTIAISGYTGCRVHCVTPSKREKRRIVPSIGYSGWYNGKTTGKIGVVELHRNSIAQPDSGTDPLRCSVDTEDLFERVNAHATAKSQELVDYEIDVRVLQGEETKPLDVKRSFLPVEVSPSKSPEKKIQRILQISVEEDREEGGDGGRPPRREREAWMLSPVSPERPMTASSSPSRSDASSPLQLPDASPSKLSMVGYTGWYKGKKNGRVGLTATRDTPISVWEVDPIAAAADANRRVITPMIGFTGYYRGKSEGKLGIINLHKSSLADFDHQATKVNYGDRLEHSPMFPQHYHQSEEAQLRPLQQQAVSMPESVLLESASMTSTIHSLPQVQGRGSRSVSQLIAALKTSLLRSYDDLFKARKNLKHVFVKDDPSQCGVLSREKLKYALQHFYRLKDILPEEFLTLCEEFRCTDGGEGVSYVKLLNSVTPSLRAL